MDSCVCRYMWQPEEGIEYFLLLFVLLLRNRIWPAGSGNDLSLPYNAGVAGVYSSAHF